MVISNNYEKGNIVKFPPNLEVKTNDVIVTVHHHFNAANKIEECFESYLKRQISNVLEGSK